MRDWEVKVITQSGYIQSVRVDNCITREDANAAALGMTGAKSVIVSNPKTYYDDITSNDVSQNNYDDSYLKSQLSEIYDAQERTEERERQRDLDKSERILDKLEIEMYDLECRLALEAGKEMPSIKKFKKKYNRNDVTSNEPDLYSLVSDVFHFFFPRNK
jgi:hypothetical protein